MDKLQSLDLGTVFNNVTDPMFVLAVEGERFRCIAINRAVCEVTGRPYEHFVPRYADEIEPLWVAERLTQHYSSALAEWSPQRFEDTLGTLQGNFAVEITVTPFENHDGQRFLLGVGRDVTEYRRAQRDLRTSRDRLSEILESISDGFCVYDEQWRFAYVNDSAERMLGRPREELLGKSVFELYPATLGTVVEQQFKTAMAEGRPVAFEAGSDTLDTVFAARAYPGPHGLSVYFRDVGEQRRVEEQMRQIDKMQAVGQLAGGIAHDFNNLLSSIRGHGELALNRLPDETRVGAHLHEVLDASERAAELVRRLVAFSSSQVRQVRLVDVGEVIDSLRRLLAPLLGERVLLEVSVEADLPPVKVDVSQLEQALINLAVNARDAMPDGGVLRLEVTAIAHDAKGGPVQALQRPPSGRWVLIAVEDGGVGIDEEHLPRIFEPFFTTKEPDRGTGLGLATVYTAVRLAGGDIAVDSAVARGTRFRMWLPGAVGQAESLTGVVAAPPQRGDGQLVLLVEDEDAVRRVMRTVLEEQGYEVQEAANAAQALAHVDGGLAPSVLVSDVVMPGLDGPALAATLRARSPQLRVLLVSGHPRDRWPPGLEDFAHTTFLQKPFGLRELAGALRELIDG